MARIISVSGRHRACCQRGVAHDGLGVSMLVVGIGVMDTLLHQVTKTTLAQYIGEAARQISAQGIDGNLHNKFRLFTCPCSCCNDESGIQLFIRVLINIIRERKKFYGSVNDKAFLTCREFKFSQR